MTGLLLIMLIRLSSIHSEKGKTNAATLTLETSNRTHFIQRLMPWLEGKKAAATRPQEAATKKNMMFDVYRDGSPHAYAVPRRAPE